MAKPSIEQTPCKTSCCKTPYRCATTYSCRHHVIDHEANLRNAAEARKRHTSPKEER